MTTPVTSSATFFEAKYGEHADPWNFERSPYELGRYDAIVAAIGHRRYRYIFEPGCSIGILTERLAYCGDHVSAVDFSPTAAAQAQARCAHLPGVTVTCASLADAPSSAGFDLIVLSEIGYYFSLEEWTALSTRLIDEMTPGATMLAAHWLGRSNDHRLTGDEVHAILRSHPGLRLQHSERHPGFRLDRWVRA